MPNKELQNILGARFKEHTHSTDESVWTAIESQLNSEKSDRAGFWFWIINGLAATLFIGLIVESTIQSHPGSTSLKSRGESKTSLREVKKEQLPNQNSPIIRSTTNQSLPDEPSERELFSIKPESHSTNSLKQKVKISNSKNLYNRSEGNSFSTVSADLTPFVVLPKMQEEEEEEEEVENLPLRPFKLLIRRGDISNSLPISTNHVKRNIFNYIPVHLGFEMTYLEWSSAGKNSLSSVDVTNSYFNSGIEENRHFEFSILSQFDLTKRFSTSIGIGYSQWKIINSYSGIAASNNLPSDFIESNQYAFTVPLQAKFAFVQRNRFMIGSGLTFQGEFGRVSSSKIDQQPGVSVTTYPMVTNQSYENSENRVQQFALEPFVQFSIGLSPRISTFANLGYRWYFDTNDSDLTPIGNLNYFNADVGILIKIR